MRATWLSSLAQKSVNSSTGSSKPIIQMPAADPSPSGYKGVSVEPTFRTCYPCRALSFQAKMRYMLLNPLFCYCFSQIPGPGCSATGLGALAEVGPFLGKNNKLVSNKHSWNKGMNVKSRTFRLLELLWEATLEPFANAACLLDKWCYISSVGVFVETQNAWLLALQPFSAEQSWALPSSWY